MNSATVAVLRVAMLAVLITLSGCGLFAPKEPGIGKPVQWSKLERWSQDDLASGWQALLQQCPRLSSRDQWSVICSAATALNNPSPTQIRAFIEQRFKPHRVYGKKGTTDGLITGYYEPLLNGSLQPSERYAYPLYETPPDMLTIELESVYPSLKGMRLRGRLEGNRIIPFYARGEIDGGSNPLSGNEILWVDDPYGSFFLQIQGSGRVRLEDGSIVGVNYANQNGHPYFAIGKTLVEQGELNLDDVSLFTIKSWLRDNPERAEAVLNKNPSYVFFNLREDSDENARGSLNVPLTAGRSLAVDRNVIPLGTLVWLETTLPDGASYHRLMIAQDTGGAIRGPVRADVFFGAGENAEQLAGEMKQQGRMFALLPIDSETR
ncbi:MAG: murein transglycosylase A [Pseudomonadota bacterium]